jgi:hypothetical protein
MLEAILNITGTCIKHLDINVDRQPSKADVDLESHLRKDTPLQHGQPYSNWANLGTFWTTRVQQQTSTMGMNSMFFSTLLLIFNGNPLYSER